MVLDLIQTSTRMGADDHKERVRRTESTLCLTISGGIIYKEVFSFD